MLTALPPPPTRPLDFPHQYHRPDGAAITEAQLEALRAVSTPLGKVWVGGPLLRSECEIPPHALQAAGLVAHDEA